MTCLEAALQYLERGWSPFPVRGKISTVAWERFQTERATPDELRAAFGDDPTLGVAITLGRLSGVIRVDADGLEALSHMQSLGESPPTLSFSSPSGGRGFIHKHLDGVRTERVWKGAGDHQELRVQSDGAYTVLPPSPGYVWLNDAAVAAVPDWLHDRAVERVVRDLVRELRPTLRTPDRDEIKQALEHIDPDDYNDWVAVGMALHSAGAEYMETWLDWSKKSNKFREGECERKWNSFQRDLGGVSTRTIFYLAEKHDGWCPPSKHEPLTDLGNARVLARVGEGRILHCSKWGWLAWDGKRWKMDGAEKAVQELQKQALEYRLNRAVESLARHIKSSDPEAPDYAAVRKSKSRTITAIRRHEEEARIRGARILASSEPCIAADYTQFDSHPFLLNCANGTVDVRLNDVKPHEPTDYITQMCPTDYDSDASCPAFDSFLAAVLPDSAVRSFLQAFLGCCLTGDVTCQVMPVFYGTGANGKSTLINAVRFAMGDDYFMKAKRDFLMVRRHSDHPTSVARMRGKRLVVCVETEENGRIDETLVKELTGGDEIAARRMREDEWQFAPTHKLILVTNHKPEVRGTDDAIWRRLPLVPFERKFPEGDPARDPDLLDKLKGEASGILNWMLAGAAKWLEAGKRLDRPDAVQQATTAYREEQDRIGSFIADKCVVGEGRRGRVEKLMEAYLLWCHANKHAPLNGNAFGRALTERGYALESKGSKYRAGIDLSGEKP